jgi:hypothetical protein
MNEVADFNWSPLHVFICTWLASAITGVGVYLGEDRAVTIRGTFVAAVTYGGMGCGLGMIGYEFLGGKQAPWKIIGCGFLVGIRAISLNSIKTLIQRILGPNGRDKSSHHQKPLS